MGLHYDAVLMPIAFAALLDALGDRRTGRATLWWAEGPRPARRLRVTAVAVSAAGTLALGPAMPVLDVLRPAQWEPTWRAEPAAAALEAVPEDAVLAVDITLMAQAVPEHDVQWLHGPNERVPDCMLSDQYAFSWGGAAPQDPAAWAQERWGAEYLQRYDGGGFAVVCRAQAG